MAFPTTAVLDNFNRANEGPPPSANWTNNVLSASGGETLVVDTNRLAATASGDAFWSASTFGPDSEVYVTVVTLPTLSFRLFIRLTDIPGSGIKGYQMRFDVGTNNLTIGRWDSGALTQLGSVLPFDVTAGDKVGVEMSGSTFSYYRNGGSWAFIDSRSDATYNTAGFIAVRINDTTARLDDFGGGTVASGPPAPAFIPAIAYTVQVHGHRRR